MRGVAVSPGGGGPWAPGGWGLVAPGRWHLDPTSWWPGWGGALVSPPHVPVLGRRGVVGRPAEVLPAARGRRGVGVGRREPPTRGGGHMTPLGGWGGHGATPWVGAGGRGRVSVGRWGVGTWIADMGRGSVGRGNRPAPSVAVLGGPVGGGRLEPGSTPTYNTILYPLTKTSPEPGDKLGSREYCGQVEG